MPKRLLSAAESIRGTATNTRTDVYGESGNCSIPALSLGSWDLHAELDGFKTAVINGIGLNASDARKINVQLDFGAICKEINSLQVEAINGEVTDVVTCEQVREVPLNGRNFAQLPQLMPAIRAIDGLLSGASPLGLRQRLRGRRRRQQRHRLQPHDPDPRLGRRRRGLQYSPQLLRPRIRRRRRRAGQPCDPRRHQRLGGSIVKDKVHFFVSSECNDEELGTARAAQVPAAAERIAFSGSSNPPIDPLTGNLFPGNVIPVAVSWAPNAGETNALWGDDPFPASAPPGATHGVVQRVCFADPDSRVEGHRGLRRRLLEGQRETDPRLWHRTTRHQQSPPRAMALQGNRACGMDMPSMRRAAWR